jgi:hypothetical protein
MARIGVPVLVRRLRRSEAVTGVAPAARAAGTEPPERDSEYVSVP